MEQEHESEVELLKNRIDELEKQHRDLKLSHQSMIDKLKDKIECPVCMEIPRKGPVPVCPNGHFVCPKCKNESCPTCRSIMGSNKSILAGTIIDNIEHKCMFEDCDQSFLLADLGKHEEACPHRIVNCPHTSCNVKVSLSKLRSHVLDKRSCRDKNVKVKLNNNKRCNSYRVTGNMWRPNITWGLKTFTCEDMDFVFYAYKSEGCFYFLIVMLGTEVECSEYTVELEVQENTESAVDGPKISYKFCGNPTSIDVEKKKLDSIRINETSMKRLLDKSDSASFSVSYSVVKEK